MAEAVVVGAVTAVAAVGIVSALSQAIARKYGSLGSLSYLDTVVGPWSGYFCDAPAGPDCTERSECQSYLVSINCSVRPSENTLMPAPDAVRLERQNSALDCRQSNLCAP